MVVHVDIWSYLLILCLGGNVDNVMVVVVVGGYGDMVMMVWLW